MLQIAYMNNFKNQPTLLLAGDASAVNALFELFSFWHGEQLDVVKYMEAKIKLHLSGIRGLMLVRSFTAIESEFELRNDLGTWNISEPMQTTIADLLLSLGECGVAAHQYLDSGRSGIQILCSMNEYPVPI